MSGVLASYRFRRSEVDISCQINDVPIPSNSDAPGCALICNRDKLDRQGEEGKDEADIRPRWLNYISRNAYSDSATQVRNLIFLVKVSACVILRPWLQ